MKSILDFGAGYRAIHTTWLREQLPGHRVTAHDFGRNVTPGIHDPHALNARYDLVFASNVLNVHATAHALQLTLAQLCLAVAPDGIAVVNYPATPRKRPGVSANHLETLLLRFFGSVARRRGVWHNSPTWRLALPNHPYAARFPGEFTPEEIATANIRPAGAVGPKALVPRLVLTLLRP